jgi:hypothetical protein
METIIDLDNCRPEHREAIQQILDLFNHYEDDIKSALSDDKY